MYPRPIPDEIVGENVPEVILPLLCFEPLINILCPFLGIPLSVSFIPTNWFFKFIDFIFFKDFLATYFSLCKLTNLCNCDWNGLYASEISFPCNGNPASILKTSLAPKPHGVTPLSNKDCHKTFSQALSDLEKSLGNTQRCPAPLDYLEKFAIYCLVNNDQQDEAQLLLDLFKELINEKLKIKEGKFIRNKIILKNLNSYGRNFSTEQILNAVTLLRDCDLIIKTTSMDEKHFFHSILIEVCEGNSV